MNHLLTTCSQSTLIVMVCRLSLLVLNTNYAKCGGLCYAIQWKLRGALVNIPVDQGWPTTCDWLKALWWAKALVTLLERADLRVYYELQGQPESSGGGERLSPKLLDHYLHLTLDMLQLLLWCFAHLLIQKIHITPNIQSVILPTWTPQ